MKIIIETISHSKQRYRTVGDWQWVQNELHIYVSEMKNWRYELLVAIHELVEVHLCKLRGVTQEEIDMFDRAFEESRKADDISEPGDATDAPYKDEHFFATSIERLLALELSVDWNKYEDKINSL